jgi:hypothetical protein
MPPLTCMYRQRPEGYFFVTLDERPEDVEVGSICD